MEYRISTDFLTQDCRRSLEHSFDRFYGIRLSGQACLGVSGKAGRGQLLPQASLSLADITVPRFPTTRRNFHDKGNTDCLS